MIRVLVTEDSPTARKLLVHLLDEDSEIQVVGEATNGLQAVDWHSSDKKCHSVWPKSSL